MKSFIIKEPKDSFDRRPWEEIVFTVDSELNLTDMLESFERFLRAAGYYFDGRLDIVDEEKQEEDESVDGEEENEF